jgi:hypothetical protein
MSTGWGGGRQGDLKLDNLRLRPEALAQFNLPITVCAGFIGQLSLSIPWQALGRRPVVRSHPALHPRRCTLTPSRLPSHIAPSVSHPRLSQLPNGVCCLPSLLTAAETTT